MSNAFITWTEASRCFAAAEPMHQEDAWAYFDSSMEDKKPEVCPEVWNTEPVNPDQAMSAVRALCKGG